MSEKEKEISAIDFINEIIHEHNVASTFGTLVLRNGVLVKVRKYFEFFREMWNEYKYLDVVGPKEELDDFLKNQTVGGVISNGEVDIFLPDILATVSEYEIIKNLQDEDKEED